MKKNILNQTKLLLGIIAIALMVVAGACNGEPPYGPDPGGPGWGNDPGDGRGGKGDPNDPGDGRGGNGGGNEDPGDGRGGKEGKPPVGEDPGENTLPEDPENPNECSFEGELFWPIDGCNLTIKTPDGKWLYPINQEKLNGLKSGDKVKFGYVYRHNAFTSCMAGWNIELTCLQAVNSNSR